MWRRALVALSLVGAAAAAPAADYRSVNVPAAILYDAPSLAGKKLYLIKAQTPVEIIVRLEGWLKVRDAEGSLAWIEARNLSDKRTLVVTAPLAEIRQADLVGEPCFLGFGDLLGVAAGKQREVAPGAAAL